MQRGAIGAIDRLADKVVLALVAALDDDLAVRVTLLREDPSEREAQRRIGRVDDGLCGTAETKNGSTWKIWSSLLRTRTKGCSR